MYHHGPRERVIVGRRVLNQCCCYHSKIRWLHGPFPMPLRVRVPNIDDYSCRHDLSLFELRRSVTLFGIQLGRGYLQTKERRATRLVSSFEVFSPETLFGSLMSWEKGRRRRIMSPPLCKRQLSLSSRRRAHIHMTINTATTLSRNAMCAY